MARSSARGSGGLLSREALRRGGGPVQFFQETIAELRKSVWPTREQTVRLTGYVIVLSAAIGAMLFALDNIFGQTFGRFIIR